MDRGLYIAASGMLAEQARQEQLANDLANVSTAGYKADRVTTRSFGDVLLQNTRSGAIVGPLGLGTQVARKVTDLAPQALRQTDEPLDMAVEGAGFFAVQTPQGVRYTRNGQFAAGPDGMLADQLGHHVLGPNRTPIRVGADGTVPAAAVGVFDVGNARKQGDTLFTGVARGPATGVVRTGELEGSGVDSARVMVDLISSLRAFESSQRAITTIDETLKQASTSVGTLS